MPDTASDLFVERLMEWGVDTVFGLPGDGINGFVEALRTRHDRLRYIHVRYEEVGAGRTARWPPRCRTRSARRPRSPIARSSRSPATGRSPCRWATATLMQHDLPVKVVCFRNDSLGLIKWEQMVFLGDPEYGVDFASVDFVKVGEACGATAVRIEDPETCGEQLRAALAAPGPVVVEAVVDQNEPPMPAKVTSEHAKAMYDALRRGEESRTRIGLTIGRSLLQEAAEPASPYGVLARVREKVGGGGGSGGDGDGDGAR